MAEQPPELRPEPRRYKRRPSAARWLAALAGFGAGLALIAFVAWALLFRAGDGEAVEGTASAVESVAPPKPVLKIVFPEGFTRTEMAERIAEVNEIAEQKREVTPKLSPRAFLRLTKSVKLVPKGFEGVKAPHLEGFLFPATYEFTEETATRELVEMQLAAFERAWAKLDLRYARSKNLTPYDVLIIASMVEKEVQVPKERPLVAAVIYNRLRVGLPLGIDATIRYGLGIPPTKAIRKSQLDSDNPYNTRKFAGLPPTPIASPGLASMQAAAHPADVDYLYFVRKPDCKSHFFTASEQEFLDYPRAGLKC